MPEKKWYETIFENIKTGERVIVNTLDFNEFDKWMSRPDAKDWRMVLE